MWDGLAGASQLTNEGIKSLEDAQWIQGSNFGRDNAKDIFEFLFYMFHISGKARRAALTLSFKPGDKVVAFITNLETKMMESNNFTEPQTTFAAPLMAEQEERQSFATVAAKSAEVCTYCNKPGHGERRCYRRQSEMLKAATLVGDTVKRADQAKGNNLSFRPKRMITSRLYHDQRMSTGSTMSELPTPPNRWITQRGSGQFCAVHGKCKHTTDQCLDISRLKEDKQQRGTTGVAKTSGEDLHQQTKKPD